MRRLCFGGSFNPIHHAHLICARAIAEAADFDRVVLIPSAAPPHKPASPDLVAPEHRLAMCQLAAAMEPALFEASDIEVRRPGRSYTIDTVRQLKSSGQSEVFWLIGADMLLFLQNWHQFDHLVKETKFVVMQRPGFAIDWTAQPPSVQHLQDSTYIAPQIELSATDLRARIAAGRSIRFLVPPAVEAYVSDHQLYGRPPA